MRYIITYATELDNGFVDTRQIVLHNRHNANLMYKRIFKNPATISIRMETQL